MTKRIRFISEYASHYLKKYFWVVLLSSILGSALYLEQSHLNEIYQSLQIKNLDIGVEGLYTIQTLPSSVTGLITYGFSEISENDRPILSPIIKKLDMTDSYRSYTFTFQDGLYWHNGKKFTVSDFDLQIPGIKTEIVSQNQLVIKTNDIFSPLLSILSKPIFMRRSLIGLGQYRVNNITYKDGYINILSLISTKDSRQKITYHFYSNAQDLLNAFKLGEVDQITIDNLRDNLSQWPNLKISQQISSTKYLAIFLNTEKLVNKQLRQAIAYATPKSNDKNDRCLGPISPNSWAYNSQIKEYNFNVTRAKELFEPNKVDHLNLVVSDRTLLNTAEEIKTNWENTFKIKVNLTIENKQINPTDYEAVLAYGYIPTDPDQYTFWHSTQTTTNITHLNNSRIDKLLEEGRQTQDQLERKKIYQDFQKYLLEESPAIFLSFPTTYTISRLK